VVIVVPSTTAELRALLQATIDLDNFVAFASSTVDAEDDFDYGGHRITLNPDAFVGRSESSALNILAHELLHVATRSVSGPLVPIVIEEGIAQYVGYDAEPATIDYVDSTIAAASRPSLPRDHEFTTGAPEDISESYREALSATAFFVRRWGIDDLESFYRRLGRSRVVAGTARYHLERALRATIGVGEPRFERLWADSIGSR
jgi:hypothetical protein